MEVPVSIRMLGHYHKEDTMKYSPSRNVKEMINKSLIISFKNKKIHVKTDEWGLINEGPQASIGRTPVSYAKVYKGKIKEVK